MKAIVCTQYGSPDFLELQDVPKPVPKENEILIKIHATTVSAADHRIRSASFPFGFGLLGKLALGFGAPRKSILGTELAGEVEAIEEGVTSFQVGDQVYALSGVGLGAHAEYICLAETAAVTQKPTNMSYAEATAIPFGSGTALYYLKNLGHITKGQKVLVYGASGAVGSAAVQLAKYYGAEVTAVCSTANIELVKSLGADYAIDYTREDFTNNGGEYYDIILETVGKISFARCRDCLAPKGLYLFIAGGLPDFGRMIWTSIVGGKKVIGGVCPGSKEDLVFLRELIEAGKLRAVIDRSYPLAEIAEAHLYVDAGHKKGNVVIEVV